MKMLKKLRSLLYLGMLPLVGAGTQDGVVERKDYSVEAKENNDLAYRLLNESFDRHSSIDENVNFKKEYVVASNNLTRGGWNLDGIVNSERVSENDLEKFLIKNYGLDKKTVKEVKEILSDVKYPSRPVKMFAGRMPDNEKIEVIERDRDSVKKAIGMASIYSSDEGWSKTSTGGRVKDDKLTAAGSLYWGVEYPALFKARNVENGKESYFVIDSTGPYKVSSEGVEWINKKRGIAVPHQERIIDMSPKLAKELGAYEGVDRGGNPIGLAEVEVEYLTSLSGYIK